MFKELADIDQKIVELINCDSFCDNITPPFLRDAVLSYPLARGKRLRPALLLWSCGLCGGSPEKAWQAALAVELYHNWTLIHDDIIDDDAIRRNQPSCHIALKKSANVEASEKDRTLFGKNMAILAGDILHGWAMHSMCAMKEHCRLETVVELMTQMSGSLTTGLISGEAADVWFETRDSVCSDEVLKMLERKTSLLLDYAASAGAAIALGCSDFSDKRVRAIGSFARSAGLAFQLQDDLLGIFASEKKLGKPLGSDISSAKKTFLILETLKRANDSQKEKIQLLFGCRRTLSVEELEIVRAIITETGAKKNVQQMAENFAAKAEKFIAEYPESKWKKILLELLQWLINRDN